MNEDNAYSHDELLHLYEIFEGDPERYKRILQKMKVVMKDLFRISKEASDEVLEESGDEIIEDEVITESMDEIKELNDVI